MHAPSVSRQGLPIKTELIKFNHRPLSAVKKEKRFKQLFATHYYKEEDNSTKDIVCCRDNTKLL